MRRAGDAACMAARFAACWCGRACTHSGCSLQVICDELGTRYMQMATPEICPALMRQMGTSLSGMCVMMLSCQDYEATGG